MTAISQITAQSQILMYLFPSLSSWFSLPILPPKTVCLRFLILVPNWTHFSGSILTVPISFRHLSQRWVIFSLPISASFQGREYMQWPMLPQGGDSHKLLSAFSCLATGDLYLKSDRNIPQERKGMPQIRSRSDLKR